MKFTAENVETSLYYLNEYLGISKDIDIDFTAKSTVEYSIDINAREWGIKWIAISIDKVVVNVQCEIATEFLTEEEKKEIFKIVPDATEYKFKSTIDFDLKLDDLSADWEIKNEIGFAEDGALQIDDIEIDLVKKSVVVSNVVNVDF